MFEEGALIFVYYKEYPLSEWLQEGQHQNCPKMNDKWQYTMLYLRRAAMVLKKGSISAVAAQFSCSPKTVSRKRAQESIAAGSVVADVSSHKKGNSGRKRRNPDEIQQAVHCTPLRSQGTIQRLSA